MERKGPRFEVEAFPGGLVLRVIGEVVWPHEEEALRQALRSVVQDADDVALVVVDLEQLTEICGDGSDILFRAVMWAQKQNLRLAAAPLRVTRRLERTGLDRFVTVYPSVTAVFEALPPATLPLSDVITT